MPLYYLRRLTGSHRTEAANRHLARYLAFVAGAANAGGFLAVHQYTAHMSGIVSTMAYELATGRPAVVWTGLAAVVAFVMGAVVTSLLVRWARSRALDSEYALPLTVEALLLMLFGLTGRVSPDRRPVMTIVLLCFTMGLQNAIITKISRHVIRTTHLTGMLTDIGIALGALLSSLRSGGKFPLAGELAALRLLSSLVLLFFLGGVTGALGFQHIGFLFTLPLAVVLFVLAAMPIVDDLRRPIAIPPDA